MSDRTTIVEVLGDAATDAGDLALIYSGRAQLAAFQLRLLFLRLEIGLPAGRGSIANLLQLVEPLGPEVDR